MCFSESIQYHNTKAYQYFPTPLVCTSDPLCTRWSLDVEQLLHSQRIGLLITHHGNIVQTVKVGQSL